MKYFCMLIALLIVDKCHGQSNSKKRLQIVGGAEVGIADYPYQGGFLYNGKLKCGCSVISKDCILTAAHCTVQFNQNISVRLGSSLKHQGGVVYNIDQIINHPSFHPVRLYNDVAILKPFDEISFDNPNVKKIRLPEEFDRINDGTSCRVSGWGKAENDTRPEKLRAVAVKIVNFEECQRNYNTDKVKFRVTSQMLCAGWSEGVKDACSGDSGGPLVCDGKQIGIVSSGYGCGLKNYPGIYTRVTEMRKWIAEHCNL